LLANPALCRKMGSQARNRIRDHFSIDRHVGRLQEILDDARRLN
jgi:glycosyltransferase involved in cell wall biosynthesis